MSDIERVIDLFYNEYKEKMVNVDKADNGYYKFTKGIFSYKFILSNELETIINKYRDKDDFNIFLSLLKYISIVATVYANILDLPDFKILRTYLKHNCRVVLEEDKIKRLLVFIVSQVDTDLYNLNTLGRLKLTNKANGIIHSSVYEALPNENFNTKLVIENIVHNELYNLYNKDAFEYKIIRNYLDISILKIWLKCSINKGE
jgi:hypothetical protein